MKFAVISFALMLATVDTASAQEPVRIEMDHSVPWTHEQSGLVIPPSIDAIPRRSATAFAIGGWDQSVQFETADSSTIISVYIYQAAVQDVGVLFAEAQKPLEGRVSYYGAATPIAPPLAFSPPGDAVMSGLKIFYNTTGQYRSTALAIVAVGEEWIVKFRLSSKDKTPADLQRLLTQSIAAIAWPKAVPHGVASLPSVCAKSLSAMPEVKPVRGNTITTGLLGSIIGLLPPASTADDPATGTKGVRYCRDMSASIPFSVYRPDGAEDRYIISLGDSGRAVFVEPDLDDAILSKSKTKAKQSPAYSIRMVVPGQSISFQPHRGFVPPKQALRIVAAGQHRWRKVDGALKFGWFVTLNEANFDYRPAYPKLPSCLRASEIPSPPPR
jgi:hypothetical protein